MNGYGYSPSSGGTYSMWFASQPTTPSWESIALAHSETIGMLAKQMMANQTPQVEVKVKVKIPEDVRSAIIYIHNHYDIDCSKILFDWMRDND